MSAGVLLRHRTAGAAHHTREQARGPAQRPCLQATRISCTRISAWRQQQQQQAGLAAAAAAAAVLLQVTPALALPEQQLEQVGAVALPQQQLEQVGAVALPQQQLEQVGAVALPQQQLEQVRAAIERDFVQGQYYVTGQPTAELYANDCVFVDPTINVKGLKTWSKAVSQLFDPDASRADLISSSVSEPNTITLRWRLEGRLKLGNLPIKPYTGTTVYSVDGASGLISRHEETWDISVLDAFLSSLLPGFGAPPAPPVE